jgi:hypothetical protein
VSAELAARRTAAAALLADWHSEWHRYLGAPVDHRPPDYAVWVPRLASMLALLLDGLAVDDTAAAQLAEVRAVLGAFDWETDDRQYALEKIDGLVNGEGR